VGNSGGGKRGFLEKKGIKIKHWLDPGAKRREIFEDKKQRKMKRKEVNDQFKRGTKNCSRRGEDK